MYNKVLHSDILQSLTKMHDKLDAIQIALKDNEAIKSNEEKQTINKPQSAPEEVKKDTMWNLTQMQYELSNELFAGIKKLKQIINEGEKHTNKAKNEYQK